MQRKVQQQILKFAPMLSLALITSLQASSQEVRSNYVPGTDFSKYRTYCWANVPNAVPDQILDAQIKRSIDSQLAAKGLTKISSESASVDAPSSMTAQTTPALPSPPPGLPEPPPGLPNPPSPPQRSSSNQPVGSLCKADLVLAYGTALTRETQWNGFGTFDRLGYGLGTAMGTATSSTINVGSLVLNMYDPAARQLVWTGTATKTIDGNNNPQKIQKNLDKAMQKLLKDFPPRG